MKLDEASFTVFDFETTGLYPYSGDRICEIGALRIGPGGVASGEFHRLVDPEVPISPGARAVNGITDDMVRGKPTATEVIPELVGFMQGSVLVAYNAGFDMGFLAAALGDSTALDGYRVIDALRLSRRLFDGIPRYNLSAVAESLGIEAEGSHRALMDATLTWKIFRVQIEALKSMGIDTVEGVYPSVFRGGAGKAAGDSGLERLINTAIAGGRDLRIVYRSSWSGDLSERTVTPMRLNRGYDRAYLVARCHSRDAERNFRLDCIISAKESA